MVTDKEALQNFLLDIECLDKLSKWSNQFNIFEVLKITGTEIRHSNMLAWLLDPKGSHGLDDTILRAVIQRLVSDGAPLADVFQTLLMGYDDFEICREWQHIDILAISHSKRFYLCIENKVHSGEHDDQLARYKDALSKTFPDYSAIFAYLTPDGESPENEDDCQIWQVLSYKDILTIIENAIEGKSLPEDVSLLIKHYLETIRRHVVANEDIKKICCEIYLRHKQALDLIFENRFDTAAQISEVIQAWCTEKNGAVIYYNPNDTSKTFVRFTTPYMDSVFPKFEKEQSGWKTDRMYFYEFDLRQRGSAYVIRIGMSLCSINITPEQRAVCDKVSSLLGKEDKKSDWVWKRLLTYKEICRIDEDIISEETRNKIISSLDEGIKYVLAFENELKQKI